MCKRVWVSGTSDRNNEDEKSSPILRIICRCRYTLLFFLHNFFSLLLLLFLSFVFFFFFFLVKVIHTACGLHCKCEANEIKEKQCTHKKYGHSTDTDLCELRTHELWTRNQDYSLFRASNSIERSIHSTSATSMVMSHTICYTMCMCIKMVLLCERLITIIYHLIKTNSIITILLLHVV